MHSVDQVLAVIEAQVSLVVPARARIEEASGCVLAEPVTMPEDSPPFDRSVVDGYAVRSAEAGAGATLQVAGRSDAGSGPFAGVVGRQECVGINTGAMVPAEMDAVLMVEQSEPLPAQYPGGPERIRVHRGVTPGAGIQRRGADARAGERLLEAGTRLGPAQIAACAAAGVGEGGKVAVRRIRVGVLSTGDELVPAGATPGPGQIRNSNHPMLVALVHEAVGTTKEDALLDLGTCPDEKNELQRRISRGLESCDLLIISGGMSMGTRDWAPLVLRELGMTFLVEKARIKPGKPFILANLKRPGDVTSRWVAGLPGNPVSAFVTFQRFVRPVIGRLLGMTLPATPIVRARIGDALEANGDREFYHPCQLRQAGALLEARGLSWRGSADIFTVARAQGLIIRPAGAPAIQPGDEADVLTW